jgi:predicted DNA binding protein
VLSDLASVGGSVARAVLEDGHFRMTLYLPPGTDVRRITDIVRDAYPSAELVRRRQRRRHEGGPDRVRRVLATDLTDRQRVALEAAYHAGYFEWPRTTSAEELATSLDVAASTYHYHLRRAQRRVFESLLSVTTPVPGAQRGE